MKLSTLKGHRFAIAAGILVASAACPDAMLMAIVDCHELAAPARTQGSEMMDHNATHDNFGVQDYDTLKPFEILLFELKGCVCTQSLAQGIELQFIENCLHLSMCPVHPSQGPYLQQWSLRRLPGKRRFLVSLGQ